MIKAQPTKSGLSLAQRILLRRGTFVQADAVWMVEGVSKLDGFALPEYLASPGVATAFGVVSVLCRNGMSALARKTCKAQR